MENKRTLAQVDQCAAKHTSVCVRLRFLEKSPERRVQMAGPNMWSNLICGRDRSSSVTQCFRRDSPSRVLFKTSRRRSEPGSCSVPYRSSVGRLFLSHSCTLNSTRTCRELPNMQFCSGRPNRTEPHEGLELRVQLHVFNFQLRSFRNKLFFFKQSVSSSSCLADWTVWTPPGQTPPGQTSEFSL